MQDFPCKNILTRPAFLQRNNDGTSHFATALCIALLSACGLPHPAYSAGPPPERLHATEIGQVHQLHVSAGECTAVLADSLRRHGYAVSNAKVVDASLKVALSHKRPLRENLPIIKTLGWQAHYRAELTGAGERVLLSLFGQEGSLTFRELCDDIGDEIAYKLKEYLSGRE